MTRRFCILLVVALPVAWWVTANSGAAADDASNVESQIAKLMVERRDTLRKRSEAVKAMHANGTLPVERVIAADNELLNAELELVSSQPERVQLCQKRVENLRFLENVITQRHAAGQATVEETLSTKAARLQAEIDCLREQSSLK